MKRTRHSIEQIIDTLRQADVAPPKSNGRTMCRIGRKGLGKEICG